MNILVVDDEEAHRKLLGNFLQVEGRTVVTAEWRTRVGANGEDKN